MSWRLAVACAWVAAVAACGGNGGGGGGGGDGGMGNPIHVTGQVARTGARVGRSGLGPADLPGLGDGSQIDRIVALSHSKGMLGWESMDNAVVADLPADGSFDLELQSNIDYVLLLEDSTAPRWERVRAFVTLADLENTLVTLPLSRASQDLALGLLTDGEGGTAVAETTLSEAAASFTLDRATLTEMARVDDAYRSLVNTWQNYDPDTKVYWSVSPSVLFQDRYERLVAGTSTPEHYTFLGYIVYLETNDALVDPAALCAGSQTLRVIPPADLRSLDGVVWGPSHPLTTAGAEAAADASCFGRDFGGFRGEGDGRVSMSTFILGEMVPGLWTVEVDGVPVAKFDLGLASPVDADGRAVGALPRLRPTVAADGSLAALDIDWLRWSADAVDWVDADPAALQELFRSSSASLSSLNFNSLSVFAEEGFPLPWGDVLITHAEPTQFRWHTGSAVDVPAGAPMIGEVNAFWEIGGVSYRTMWTRTCLDYDLDGKTDCEGDPDDVVPDESACRVLNKVRPAADEGGQVWHSLQANPWGSFNLVFGCSWAPGPRSYARVAYRLERLDGTVLDELEDAAFVPVGGTYDRLGAGDYRVVATAYDGLGDEHETVTTYFHALPFEATYAAPAMVATLSSSALEVVFNYQVTTSQSDTTLLCGELFDAATLALFGAAGCDTGLSSGTSCGACGRSCGGAESCLAGICYDSGGSCTYPAADCDANPGTGPGGCETDLQTSAAHCGACGHACDPGATCVAGFCREGCTLATGDCDANPGTGPDGCETDLLTSAAHCGVCGRACAGDATCVDGICVSASSPCPAGTGDCDGSAGTGPGGCEADLYADDANCGACGSICPVGTRCRGGSCHARCPAGHGDCDGAGDAPYVPFTCFYVGDGFHFRMEWGSNPPTVRVGDRITLGTATPWGCEGIGQDDSGYLIPCPEVFPPISTRIVASP